MKIILLGPPGSGKGTVSERLAKEFKLFHLSAGELLREEVRKGTTIGRAIKKHIETGALAPDNFVTEMIKLEISDKKNYLLDGSPRTIEQAKSFEELGIDLVVYLNASERVVVDRLAKRRVCKKGLHNYHLKYIPSKKKGVCDVDGTDLIRRKDDAPKVIKERFRIYHKYTEPVVKYYLRKKILMKVDAVPPPAEVYAEVKRVVLECKKKSKK